MHRGRRGRERPRSLGPGPARRRGGRQAARGRPPGSGPAGGRTAGPRPRGRRAPLPRGRVRRRPRRRLLGRRRHAEGNARLLQRPRTRHLDVGTRAGRPSRRRRDAPRRAGAGRADRPQEPRALPSGGRPGADLRQRAGLPGHPGRRHLLLRRREEPDAVRAARRGRGGSREDPARHADPDPRREGRRPPPVPGRDRPVPRSGRGIPRFFREGPEPRRREQLVGRRRLARHRPPRRSSPSSRPRPSRRWRSPPSTAG